MVPPGIFGSGKAWEVYLLVISTGLVQYLVGLPGGGVGEGCLGRVVECPVVDPSGMVQWLLKSPAKGGDVRL